MPYSLAREDIAKSDAIDTIRKYVIRHPGTTKTKVVKFMEEKGESSRTATIRIIDDLITEKIVNVLKDSPRSQTHHLFINDNNEFNLIDRELSEIEIIIHEMWEPLRKIFEYKLVQYRLKREVDPNLGVHFEYEYREAVIMMLHVLLVRSSTVVHSKNMAYILYARIIKLIQELTLQFYDTNNSTDFLNSMTRQLKILRHESSTKAYTRTRKNFVDTKTMTDLLSKMENFEKAFPR